MLLAFTCFLATLGSLFSYFGQAGKDPKLCDGNFIRPSYVRIHINTTNKRYKLFQHIEDSIKVDKGIPVLFIPGNAGTFKQIRSLGAVAERIHRWEFPNFAKLQLFTIETREELSAFSAGTLEEQAKFVNQAILHIRGLGIVTPVVLIGHSMGGVVARYIPLLDTYLTGSVMSIYTLSSPHLEPPAPISRRLANFYYVLNLFWQKHHSSASGVLANISIVSIAGGTRDTTLDSTLSYLGGISDADKTVSVVSAGIRNVWTSADHEGAVWCDQTLQILTRAIFKLSKMRDSLISTRMAVLRDLMNPLDYGGLYREIKRVDFDSHNEYSDNLSQQQDPQEQPKREMIFKSMEIIRVTENYVTIPKISTKDNETRILRLFLPSLKFSKSFKFRLLSNILNLKISICYDQRNYSNFICFYSFENNQFFLPKPTQLITSDFKIVFRQYSDPPSLNRKGWLGFHNLSIHDLTKTNNSVVLITIPPQISNGFLFSDVSRPKNLVIRGAGQWYLPFLIPYMTRISPTSLITIIDFPSLRDTWLKYYIKITPNGPLTPAFPCLLMQNMANNLKAIDPRGSILTHHTPPSALENKGISLEFYADPEVSSYDLSVSVHLWATLGGLVGDARFIVMSGISAVIMTYLLSCQSSVQGGAQSKLKEMQSETFWTLICSSGYFSLVLGLTVLGYFYALYNKDSRFVLGPHAFVNLWIFPLVSVFTIGTVDFLVSVFNILIAFGATISPRLSVSGILKLQRFAFMSGVFLALFGVPGVLVSLMALVTVFLVLVFGRQRQHEKRERAVVAFLHMLVVFLFQMPALVQYALDLQAAASPGVFDGPGVVVPLVHLVYMLVVFPGPPLPHRRLLSVGLVCAAVPCLLCGGAAVWVVQEVGLAAMVYLVLLKLWGDGDGDGDGRVRGRLRVGLDKND